MFILTTASQDLPDRNPGVSGVRNHSKDTDYLLLRDCGRAAISFAQASSVLVDAAAHASLPLFPQCQMADPAASSAHWGVRRRKGRGM